MHAPTSPELQHLLDTARSSRDVLVPGLSGAPLAFCLAALSRQRQQPLVVITAGAEAAEALYSDLNFFLKADSQNQTPLVCLYPDWDVIPYQGLSPHSDVVMRRLVAFHRLQHPLGGQIVVAPAQALLKRVIPEPILERYTFTIETHQEVDREALIRNMVDAGYLVTGQVEDPGFLASRGEILDLFTPLDEHPVRVTFFGDEVESIRTFDPETQRSIVSRTSLTIIPVREEILGSEQVAHAAQRWKELGEREDLPAHLRRQIVADLERGIYFPGIELHLGMLYPKLPLFLDYLSSRVRVVQVDPDEIGSQWTRHREQILQHHALFDQRRGLIPKPETLFVEPEALSEKLEQHPQLLCGQHPKPTRNTPIRINIQFEPTSGLRSLIASHVEEGGMLKPLVEKLRAWKADGHRVRIAFHGEVQATRLHDLLEPYQLKLNAIPEHVSLDDLCHVPFHDFPPARTVLGELSGGFRFQSGRIVLLSETDIFGARLHRTSPQRKLRNVVSSFSQLNRDDPVVHAVHGVGLFRGLVKLSMGGVEADFLKLEYQGGDKLYLPAHRLNTLQKYVGQGGSPSLDKLGGVTFERTRRKVKEGLVKLAHQLLELYAARSVVEGFSYVIDRQALEAFEATFPYEETPDQLAAIEAVYQDMAAPQPMDRLVCGDVGYGKTEVAIRAAFVAIHNNKQVAVLVPTTVLALQHYRSFVDRFADIPVHIEMLNRFRSTRDQSEVIKRIKTGHVDIVIATHRLLTGDVDFKDLGLLVVDEEHRFGVRHKERIKGLRKHLDVLSMSATPIPRTLHMALTGLRDFSLIATPPRDRLAIRTYELPFGPQTISEALRFELKRGGQVYFIHNRVQSIPAMARFLKSLVPEARVGVAHGQMDVHALEKVMVDFIERQYDILCCTTIVESGLDIPSANTMIINRADRLGLAQLYQLRGRVGRSSRRAFCYLLTPANATLPDISQKRLSALVNNTELGAGFKIATEDLEMRGAGDLLGTSQSGSINAVGFDMYCELLERTIHELKGEQILDEIEPDIDLKTPAFMPEDYIPDLHHRLYHYKALSDAPDEEGLLTRKEELVDRYGPLPAPMEALMELMRVRLVLRAYRVRSLTRQLERIVFRFDDSSPINRARVIELMSKEPQRYRVTQDHRWVVTLTTEESEVLARSVKKLLQMIK